MPPLALLVIDVQRGAFDGARCPPIARAGELVERVGAAIGRARSAALPIVFVQHSEPAGVFAEGTPQFELHEALAPARGELRITKRHSSSFDDTTLVADLARLSVCEVVLCGLQSEFCVYNTALGALTRDLRVTVLHDAHSTWPTPTETAEAISARINSELSQRGANLCATKDLEAYVQRSG
ncbi:MAG TPA: isochorismatase family protein [Myxococcota bacterium]|nr:isochorismatase family protein [Myxococcota bacterium]